MIKATFDDTLFLKEMKGLVDYSLGYIEGIKRGKAKFLDSLGESVVDRIKEYVDANARLNPEMLHHVYEWGMTGSPSARLYNIKYTVSGLGLSFKSSFTQSSSISEGSKEPFYNKAKIMESGVPVRIEPKAAKFLTFTDNDTEVFTKNPVTIRKPGGPAVEGSFEKVFDEFFNNYFSQAFLKSSGIEDYLKNPVLYKKNLRSGIKGGKSKGIEVGYRWIANAALGDK